MTSATATRMTGAPATREYRRLGWAWLLLCFALVAHVTDEALTGFLSIYNPTVREVARRTGFHLPVFQFLPWLIGLMVGAAILLALSPFAFRNARPWRWLAYLFAAIMAANALAHTTVTVLGHTFASIPVPRPAPGFYSSPFMFAAALWLFWNLRRSA